MTPADIVISFFERVYNQKDFEYVMDIYADDYYEHTETGARSKQDCREIMMGACVAFPDLHVEVNELVAQDDIVATRLTFTATHKDEILGVPITNKTIAFEAMEFFKVIDGLITESWGSWPIYDIVQKLQN